MFLKAADDHPAPSSQAAELVEEAPPPPAPEEGNQENVDEPSSPQPATQTVPSGTREPRHRRRSRIRMSHSFFSSCV